jgi:hypothetical protein
MTRSFYVGSSGCKTDRPPFNRFESSPGAHGSTAMPRHYPPHGHTLVAGRWHGPFPSASSHYIWAVHN